MRTCTETFPLANCGKFFRVQTERTRQGLSPKSRVRTEGTQQGRSPQSIGRAAIWKMRKGQAVWRTTAGHAASALGAAVEDGKED